MTRRIPVELSKPQLLGLTSFKGVNFPWIMTNLGDGYSAGFTDYWDQTDTQNRLNALSSAGIKYVRFWLNMSYYMTTDANGFVSFSATFLSRLDTLINTMIPAAGMKAYVCLSDSNTEFQWDWLNDPTKSDNYITAYETIIERYADNANIWAWDFCNEPLSNYTANSVTRQTTHDFFKSIYDSVKISSPEHYYSIGRRVITDTDFDDCCDFYDIHQYSPPSEAGYPRPASDYSQPVILSECGGNVEYGNDVNVIRQSMAYYIGQGYQLVMPWDSRYILTRSGNTYSGKRGWLNMKNMREPSPGRIQF